MGHLEVVGCRPLLECGFRIPVRQQQVFTIDLEVQQFQSSESGLVDEMLFGVFPNIHLVAPLDASAIDT